MNSAKGHLTKPRYSDKDCVLPEVKPLNFKDKDRMLYTITPQNITYKQEKLAGSLTSP